jgi:hypothetical protein
MGNKGGADHFVSRGKWKRRVVMELDSGFPKWLDAVTEVEKVAEVPAQLPKQSPKHSNVEKIPAPKEAKEKPRRARKKDENTMSQGFTVVARVTGGWRAPPTIHSMTLDEARERCKELCNRYPHQEFDILGVIAKSKRMSKISLEPVAAAEPKRAKELPPPVDDEDDEDDLTTNVMRLRGNG